MARQDHRDRIRAVCQADRSHRACVSDSNGERAVAPRRAHRNRSQRVPYLLLKRRAVCHAVDALDRAKISGEVVIDILAHGRGRMTFRNGYMRAVLLSELFYSARLVI